MKRAAIITLTGANYGNRLQNLATQWIFEDRGYIVETLHNPFDPYYSDFVHKLKNIIKMMIARRKYSTQVLREKAFDSFDQQYLRYSRFWLNNERHRAKVSKEYDCFICGSDQVWNPCSQYIGANNFAMFAPSEKKITMAPSFGIVEFPEKRKEEYASYLRTFSKISVREETGAEIINSLVGRKAEVVVDPTLMISSKKWREIERKPLWLRDDAPYILCYTLGNQYMNTWIETVGAENNLKVINLMDKNKSDYFVTDPSEFLYLIDHCSLMVTDSFHGCVFSILFDRPLIVMERKDNMESMGTRIDNLLTCFGLDERRYSEVQISRDYFSHNYMAAYSILEAEIKKANSFLDGALECIEKR